MIGCSLSRRAGPFLHVLRLGLLCALLEHEGAHSHMPSYFEFTIPQKLGTKESRSPKSTISYVISAGGHKYTLNLSPNRGLLSSDFAIFSYSDGGAIVKEPIQVKEGCYHQGSIEGVIGSVVALSTCSGLKGFFQIKAVHYRIEPVEISSTFQHLIYKVEDVDYKLEKCLTLFPNKTNIFNGKYATSKSFSPLESTKYLETAIVVDNAGYRECQSNNTMVAQMVFEIINLADAIFSPLNIHIVLIRLEVWSNKDLVVFSNSTERILHAFSLWNENIQQQSDFDITYLFTSKSEIEEDGCAVLGNVCYGAGFATGILVLHAQHFTTDIALAFAHGLGHNIGITHDLDHVGACNCPAGYCMMGLYKQKKLVWSDCSVSDFEHFLISGGGVCLQNVPSAESFFTISYCGNAVVEDGEQCDCGTQDKCTKDPCCDTTCKFKNDAQCSSGGCCINCKLMARGTPCRLPVSECDLAEYCNGISSLCPKDVYSQDGTLCNNNQSYCFNKQCYDYVKHCKQLFGEEATVGGPECFSEVNIHGRRFGNCGFKSEMTLQKCDAANVMCGRLQCENVTRLHIFPKNSVVHQIPVGHRWCWTLSNDYDYNITDIGAVEDGAKCDVGKVCINRTCLPVLAMNFGCDIEKNCSGNGVCNSNNNCHCNEEWAPPDCKYRGFGGSIDSGPIVLGSFIRYSSPRSEKLYGIAIDTKAVSLFEMMFMSLLTVFVSINIASWLPT
ncbi:disintegrin and metalloproteinase domain-containing protein 9-like [Ambystoma mexicanum]|uniref:disintegrin and metalloproteinase domain-containing protein 9-like n=1 Tax=Ambystoma mexicanum TaxID=8296 RepID=UPI0037E93576